MKDLKLSISWILKIKLLIALFFVRALLSGVDSAHSFLSNPKVSRSPRGQIQLTDYCGEDLSNQIESISKWTEQIGEKKCNINEVNVRAGGEGLCNADITS